MPLTPSEAIDPTKNPLNPQGLKPCCVCPDTKKARDDCFLFFGSNDDSSQDANVKCKDLLEAHKNCMRSYGFPV